MLISSAQYTVIQYFCTFQKHHHCKSSLPSVHIQRYYNNIDYIPHIVHFTPMTHLFCNWKFIGLNFPHLFHWSQLSCFECQSLIPDTQKRKKKNEEGGRGSDSQYSASHFCRRLKEVKEEQLKEVQQRYPAASLSFPLRWEVATSHQITDTLYLEDTSCSYPDSCRLCARCSCSVCRAACQGAGWRVTPVKLSWNWPELQAFSGLESSRIVSDSAFVV